MKLAIIIVVVLVLLGGGGAAMWFLVLKEDTEEVAPKEPEPIAATFLELDALNVPVIQDGKIQRYILLRVTLDMRDDEVRTLALSYMPKLRDKYTQVHIPSA
jgi:flagellar protein FliL